LKQNGKGFFNSYFLLVVMVGLIFWGLTHITSIEQEDYTKTEFFADIEADKISQIVINPNGESPTGYVDVILKSGTEKKLYTTDIIALEQVIREYGFDPKVNDIERESWVLNTLIPLLLVLGVGVFVFLVINAQNAANNGSGKMMNFG